MGRGKKGKKEKKKLYLQMERPGGKKRIPYLNLKWKRKRQKVNFSQRGGEKKLMNIVHKQKSRKKKKETSSWQRRSRPLEEGGGRGLLPPTTNSKSIRRVRSAGRNCLAQSLPHKEEGGKRRKCPIGRSSEKEAESQPPEKETEPSSLSIQEGKKERNTSAF